MLCLKCSSFSGKTCCVVLCLRCCSFSGKTCCVVLCLRCSSFFGKTCCVALSFFLSECLSVHITLCSLQISTTQRFATSMSLLPNTFITSTPSVNPPAPWLRMNPGDNFRTLGPPTLLEEGGPRWEEGMEGEGEGEGG